MLPPRQASHKRTWSPPSPLALPLGPSWHALTSIPPLTSVVFSLSTLSSIFLRQKASRSSSDSETGGRGVIQRRSRRRLSSSRCIPYRFSPVSAPVTPSFAAGEFSTSNNPLKKFKLVFPGEQSVGKTSLITRFVRCLSMSGRSLICESRLICGTDV
jgi:hypothetical protein